MAEVYSSAKGLGISVLEAAADTCSPVARVEVPVRENCRIGLGSIVTPDLPDVSECEDIQAAVFLLGPDGLPQLSGKDHRVISSEAIIKEAPVVEASAQKAQIVKRDLAVAAGPLKIGVA